VDKENLKPLDNPKTEL
jgi:hypothetical protein